MIEIHGDGGNSTVPRTLPLSGQLKICAFAFGFAQMRPYRQTSHIRNTLSAISLVGYQASINLWIYQGEQV